MENLIKKVKYDRFVLEIPRNRFSEFKNISYRAFDLNFKNPKIVIKKELLANIEIKLHKDLHYKYVKGVGNRRICKINNKWFSLRDIENIIPKEFIIYDFSDNNAFLKISNLEKTNYLIIAGFTF